MYIDFLLDKMMLYGDKPAIVTEGKEYSYDDLIYEYKKAYDKLTEANVPDSAVVALIGEFTAENIGFMLAIINKCCIYVPISSVVKDKAQYVRISSAQYVINNGVVNKVSDIQPNHEILLSLINDKNPGMILFSSGTTGEPKAAVHNIANLLEKYKKRGKSLRSVAFLLFDHMGGFNTVMYSLSSGGFLFTLRRRTPDEVLQAIEKYKLEVLPTSPSFLNMIIISHMYEKYDLSSLKIISYGTEVMPEITLRKIHEIFPDVKLKQMYGLSEAGIMRTKSEADDSLWFKAGGDELHKVKVVDNILYIKSSMNMLGYLNAPSPFDEDGWLNTQDYVEQKGDYIKVLGRRSEIINVGGEKVFPEEVENVLLEVNGVKDAVVSKEPHPMLGNIVVCRIAADEGADIALLKKEIQKHCALRLEKFKRPVKYTFETSSFNSERFKRKR